MATKEQLRKLRQKYGLGEYRKKGKRKVFKSQSRKVSMAKRRRSSKRSSGLGGIGGQILPILLAYGYESMVSPMLPLQGTTKNIVETAGAFYLARRGGALGSTAKVVFIVEAFNLVSQLAGRNGAPASNSAYY